MKCLCTTHVPLTYCPLFMWVYLIYITCQTSWKKLPRRHEADSSEMNNRYRQKNIFLAWRSRLLKPAKTDWTFQTSHLWCMFEFRKRSRWPIFFPQKLLMALFGFYEVIIVAINFFKSLYLPVKISLVKLTSRGAMKSVKLSTMERWKKIKVWLKFSITII